MRICVFDLSIIIWLYFVQFLYLLFCLKVGEERSFIHYFLKRKASKSLLNTAPRQDNFSSKFSWEAKLRISWEICLSFTWFELSQSTNNFSEQHFTLACMYYSVIQSKTFLSLLGLKMRVTFYSKFRKMQIPHKFTVHHVVCFAK